MPQRDRLGRFGIWSGAWSSAFRDEGPARTGEFGDVAAELDALGYGTLWLGGSPAVPYAAPFLQAAPRIMVATGILSIWQHEAADVAAERAELERRFPGRFLLGLGVSHGQFTEGYARPYTAMREYLSALDSAADPVPVEARVLAALGPKMLALSRDRAAGAHPYLVTVEHTAQAREILGADALLAPEFKVVLDPDLASARETARGYLSLYLRLPNYTNNLLRLGFGGGRFPRRRQRPAGGRGVRARGRRHRRREGRGLPGRGSRSSRDPGGDRGPPARPAARRVAAPGRDASPERLSG
jgi:probable F420-dependent oxidoreductase